MAVIYLFIHLFVFILYLHLYLIHMALQQRYIYSLTEVGL